MHGCVILFAKDECGISYFHARVYYLVSIVTLPIVGLKFTYSTSMRITFDEEKTEVLIKVNFLSTNIYESRIIRLNI